MNNKPSVIWSGDPNTVPVQYLTICDVLAVGPTASADSSNNVNSVLLTLGNAQTGEVYTSNAILFNSPGVFSVPLPSGSVSNNSFSPSATSLAGAQVVAWPRNDQWIVVAVRDTRTQLNPGNIQPGEAAIQATGSASRSIYKNDGSINLYTLNGNDSMGLFISPAINSAQLVNSLGYGFSVNSNSVQMFASTSAPQGGAVIINDTGEVNLTATKQMQIDGGNIVLGSMVVAGGPNTVMINPDALSSVLTSLVTSLSALAAAVSAFTGSGTFPGIAAATAAIEAVTADILALSPLITSKKVSAE